MVGEDRGEGDIVVTWDVRKTCLTQSRQAHKGRPWLPLPLVGS